MAVSLGTLNPMLSLNSGVSRGFLSAFFPSVGVFPVGVCGIHDVIPRVELSSPVNGRLV